MKKKLIHILKEWKEYIIFGIPILFAFIGFSFESIRGKLLPFLFYELHIKTWYLIVFLISVYVVNKVRIYFSKDLKHKQIIKNGTQVILKTDTNPIMAVSKFNNKTNELLCTWNNQGELKEKWISQEVLKEYLNTEPNNKYAEIKNTY